MDFGKFCCNLHDTLPLVRPNQGQTQQTAFSFLNAIHYRIITNFYSTYHIENFIATLSNNTKIGLDP